MTVPVTGWEPPDPSRLPASPAGSVTDATSGVGKELCSPAGLKPVHLASVCCHLGTVKNGQTRAIPWACPVLSKMEKMPCWPAAGMLPDGLGNAGGARPPARWPRRCRGSPRGPAGGPEQGVDPVGIELDLAHQGGRYGGQKDGGLPALGAQRRP